MVFQGMNSFDFIFVGALKYSGVITLHSAYIRKLARGGHYVRRSSIQATS